MSSRETVKLEVEVVVDVEFLAKQFAALSDDAQAQFMCFAARELGCVAAERQAFFMGRHLATCGCSTQGGRDFVNQIAEAMNYQENIQCRK